MTAKSRNWFRIENKAETENVADIHIIDFIGDWMDDAINRFWGDGGGVTARAFVEQLAQLPDSVNTIRVHINSPGGDVQGGINIANALRAQTAKGRTVETVIEGVAASIASVIAMAGTKVVIADNALLMIHNPGADVSGTAADMRRSADAMDVVRDQIVATYQWHTSLSAEEIVAMMEAETWMGADEAIAKGFATEKVVGLKAAASITPGSVARLKVPDEFKARVESWLHKPAAPVAATAVEILAACREGDCLDLAERLLTAGGTLADVQAHVAQERSARQAKAARATEITALCASAKLPGLAAGYIAGGMDIQAVRDHLTTITAVVDKAEIDTNLNPDGEVKKAKPVIDTRAVYAQRNRLTN